MRTYRLNVICAQQHLKQLNQVPKMIITWLLIFSVLHRKGYPSILHSILPYPDVWFTGHVPLPGMHKSITCTINNCWVSQEAKAICTYVGDKAGHCARLRKELLNKLTILFELKSIFVKSVLSYRHIWVMGSPWSQGTRIKEEWEY